MMVAVDRLSRRRAGRGRPFTSSAESVMDTVTPDHPMPGLGSSGGSAEYGVGVVPGVHQHPGGDQAAITGGAHHVDRRVAADLAEAVGQISRQILQREGSRKI